MTGEQQSNSLPRSSSTPSQEEEEEIDYANQRKYDNDRWPKEQGSGWREWMVSRLSCQANSCLWVILVATIVAIAVSAVYAFYPKMFVSIAVDCQMGDWSDWSSCSVTCGHGQKTKTRDVKVNADHGGSNCSDERQQKDSCFLRACRKYDI